MRRLVIGGLLGLVLLGGSAAYAMHAWRGSHPEPWHGVSAATQTKPAPAAPKFNLSQYSTTDPASIWIIVNKQHPLNPLNYVPAHLVTPAVPLRLSASDPEMHVRGVTAVALQKLFAAADAQQIHLQLASGYRSYVEQRQLYAYYVSVQGQAVADTQSARAGYSEHQTGLAADLEPTSRQCEVQQCFGQLPEGKWLAAHAWQYGFIIRYTPGNQAITGYEAEPWHVRYVGTALAAYMHQHNIGTLEQVFGVKGGAVYAPASALSSQYPQ